MDNSPFLVGMELSGGRTVSAGSDNKLVTPPNTTRAKTYVTPVVGDSTPRKEKPPLFVGMDFGSFKTALAASNGKRHSFLSAVGWPKDHIARAVIGRDVALGEDVLRWRLALDSVRPFAKGALKFQDEEQANVSKEELVKREKAAKLLVQHAVQLVDPPRDTPVYAVVGAPSRATATNKRVLMDAVSTVFDAVMIVAEPFTVAFSMNRLVDTLVVDIGAGTTDICPIYGTYPREQDQVTIPMGGDAVDEVFYNQLRKAYPDVQLSINMARAVKEKFGFVHNLDEKIVVTLRMQGAPQQIDVTEPLKYACKSIVGPIVEGLRTVIARFDPEFQSPMLDNIVLAGGGSQLKGLEQRDRKGVAADGRGKVNRVYDSMFAGAVGALKLAMNMPRSNWERLRREMATPKKAA